MGLKTSSYIKIQGKLLNGDWIDLSPLETVSPKYKSETLKRGRKKEQKQRLSTYIYREREIYIFKIKVTFLSPVFLNCDYWIVLCFSPKLIKWNRCIKFVVDNTFFYSFHSSCITPSRVPFPVLLNWNKPVALTIELLHFISLKDINHERETSS